MGHGICPSARLGSRLCSRETGEGTWKAPRQRTFRRHDKCFHQASDRDQSEPRYHQILDTEPELGRFPGHKKTRGPRDLCATPREEPSTQRLRKLGPKLPGFQSNRSQLGLCPQPSAYPHGAAPVLPSAGSIPNPLASYQHVSTPVLRSLHADQMVHEDHASNVESSITRPRRPKPERRSDDPRRESDTYHIHLRHALSSLSRGRTRIHSG